MSVEVLPGLKLSLSTENETVAFNRKAFLKLIVASANGNQHLFPICVIIRR